MSETAANFSVASTPALSPPAAPAPSAGEGHEQKTYARRVLQSFLWQGGAQTFGQLISWAATLVVIRLLSPADYGLMAMVMLFLSFLFMVADLGVSAAAVQAKELREEQLRGVLGVVIVTSLAGATLTYVGAPLIAAFFTEPRLTEIARVLSLNFVLLAAISLPQAQLVRALDFRRKAQIDVAATAIGAGVSLGMAVAGYGVWTLVGGQLAQNLSRAVAYQAVCPIRVRPTFSFGSLSPLMRFGAILSFDRIVFFLYCNIDTVIVGRALGKEALGLYTVALTFAATPLQRIIPTITQVSFAAFSRIQTDAERVKRNVRRSFRLAAVVAFPVLLGMAAVAPVLIPLVLGPTWNAVIVPFQIICLVLPLRTLSAVLSPALMGVGRPGVNLGNLVVSLLLMAIAFLVGVQFGVLGVALSWAVMFPIVFSITTLRTMRVLAIPATGILSEIVAPVLGALTMYAGVSLIQHLAPIVLDGWLRLAVLVFSGGVIYGIYLHNFDRRLITDFRTVISA